MKLETITLAELKQGYRYDGQAGVYACLCCTRSFQEGEIYSLGPVRKPRLFEARRAILYHMEQEHPGYLMDLIYRSDKYNTLTDNQRQLFSLWAQGKSDKEIAAETGVTPSTIRHQKFMFRERAKQAKLYLALYERIMEATEKEGSAIMPVHEHAKMIDERYVITEEEREQIIASFFLSTEPLRLKLLSSKEKKKIVILARIAEEFRPELRYTEPEVNRILKEIYSDFATLRRYLIEYGFMERTRDGAAYWKT